MVSCLLTYIIVSLLGRKKPFDMDRMLHRGKYSLESERSSVEKINMVPEWKKSLGLTGKLGWKDKLTYSISYSYVFICLVLSIGGTVLHFTLGTNNNNWLSFWHIFVWFYLAIIILITLWLGIGGVYDLKKMFMLLKTVKKDSRDDGTVVNHCNLDEL